MPTRTGGTVKATSVQSGVKQAVVHFPAGNPPPPPEEDVTYPDLAADVYEQLDRALGKAVVVDVTTSAEGPVTGVQTRVP